ncbi:sialate O-acetylesterase [Hyalangium gracile]|uniref:sialate O-acetylesterase n=1 Tax=Hyalangium gracile TaxID=394092 RepID=UPI001CCD563B|nr:sialate O-acetylesterase [Hyalangium gracile]
MKPATPMRAAVAFLSTLLGAAVPTDAGAEIPVFIFAGQSNMVGYAATSSQLTGPLAAYAGAQTKVKFWGPNSSVLYPSWNDMQAPTELVNVLYTGSAFGPELSAGKDIADTLGYPRVAVVKHAVGATSLAPSPGQDWAPASNELAHQLFTRYHTAAYWMPSALGDTGRLSAFFWMQGETDGTTQESSAAYQTRLQEFISLARTGYGQPSLPFIMGQVNPSGYAAYWSNVQAAQVAVAKADPRAALVLTDDLSRNADDLHYDTAGTVELGSRFAHAYKQFATGSTGVGLLVNSGFEAQRISTSVGIPAVRNGGGTVTGALKGWTDVGYGVTLVRSHAFGTNTALASEGSQWLSLKNGYYNYGNGAATQTFPTVVGRTYTVTFNYAALSAGTGAVSSFWVGVNGVAVSSHSVSTQGTPAYFMTPWQTHTFSFVANSPLTAVGFASLDANDGTFFGAGIDNVRVY